MLKSVVYMSNMKKSEGTSVGVGWEKGCARAEPRVRMQEQGPRPELGFPPTNFLAVSSFLIESLVWNTANSAEAATISRCELP